ncbi:MAG TPA: hypothetical protein VGK74_22140 [Symbiobacteriaceae bacterium]|jgi:hypothetical protein
MARIHFTQQELDENPQLAAKIREALAEDEGVTVEIEPRRSQARVRSRISSGHRQDAARHWQQILVPVALAVCLWAGWKLGGGLIERSSAAPLKIGTNQVAEAPATTPSFDQSRPQPLAEAPAANPPASQSAQPKPPSEPPTTVQAATKDQAVAKPVGQATSPWSAYDPHPTTAPGQTAQPQLLTLKVVIMCQPMFGRLTFWANRIAVTVGIPTADGSKMISAAGIVDTGAANTVFPDSVLRRAGYKPFSGPFNVSGIGATPSTGYWYRIPFPSVRGPEAWQPLDQGALDVLGVVNSPMTEVLIGPNALRSSRLTVQDRDWSLITPCPSTN